MQSNWMNFVEAVINIVVGWHAKLFPAGRSGMHRIRVGDWRDDRAGPMQVVSGPLGRERIHFEAPKAERVAEEMKGCRRMSRRPALPGNRQFHGGERDALDRGTHQGDARS
jgi:hypothetical protein